MVFFVRFALCALIVLAACSELPAAGSGGSAPVEVRDGASATSSRRSANKATREEVADTLRTVLEAAINMLVILTLGMVSLVALLARDPVFSRKLTGWIWIFFGFVPLASRIVSGMVGGVVPPMLELVVFASLGIPVLLPAVSMVKKDGKGVSVIRAYAWMGLSVFGIVFLIFLLCIAAIFTQLALGRSFTENPLEVLGTGFVGSVWTGCAVFISSATLKVVSRLMKERARRA